jgi:hypothetical protein
MMVITLINIRVHLATLVIVYYKEIIYYLL